jgi:hypothetical protein
MQRNGNWIQTFTGKKMYPLDPRPEEICIEDIAHALSNICRFCGHSREYYSVGQHSVYVSIHCGAGNGLWGLLHDASEAYLCDVARPIKLNREFAAYRKAEHALQDVIYAKFGLPNIGLPFDVVETDVRMLVTEARDLGLYSADWELKAEPYKFTIEPQSSKSAERSFLDWWEVVTTRAART